MRLRFVFLLSLIALIQSCQFFPIGSNSSHENVDMGIDFSSVDTSPSFAICDSIIEKEAKTSCFRNTIHEHLYRGLAAQHIVALNSISEIIQVHLEIDKNGLVSLQSIQATNEFKQSIPSIDSLIQVSLKSLPALFPAIKRGIPVTTHYQLPIQITVK